MNDGYIASLPNYLAWQIDAVATQGGWRWQRVYRFALWLGLVAIDDQGGLRKVIEIKGKGTPGTHGRGRKVRVAPEAQELVSMAQREGIDWQVAQRVALTAGLETIERRGGLNETHRQVDEVRRSVMSQVTRVEL
jgi:hypothetical protein